MIVKDVLKIVSKYLEDDEMSASLEKEELTPDEESGIKKYIDLLNLTINEIATNYCPVYAKESINISGASYTLSSLSKTLFKVIKLMSGAKTQDYYILGGELFAAAGEYEIWYQYLPTECDYWLENIDFFEGKVSAKTLALGVVKEYALIKGMYDTANAFEARFTEALKGVNRKVRHRYLPKRRWL